jgi:hypothetical protein
VAALDAELKELIADGKQPWPQCTATSSRQPVAGRDEPHDNNLRDILSTDFNSIIVDDEVIAGEVKSYIREIALRRKDSKGIQGAVSHI